MNLNAIRGMVGGPGSGSGPGAGAGSESIPYGNLMEEEEYTLYAASGFLPNDPQMDALDAFKLVDMRPKRLY